MKSAKQTSVGVRAKLDIDGVKSELRILPRDNGLRVASMEPGADGNVVEEAGVLFLRPAAETGVLFSVGTKGALSPSLGARSLGRQALVSSVQVGDHVVVVVLLVVIVVAVLQEFWPENIQYILYPATSINASHYELLPLI